MARCDLCLGGCPASDLAQLRESYQVPGVRDVCPKCRKRLNKIKDDLLDQIPKQMRSAVTAMAGARTTRPRHLIRRLFSREAA